MADDGKVLDEGFMLALEAGLRAALPKEYGFLLFVTPIGKTSGTLTRYVTSLDEESTYAVTNAHARAHRAMRSASKTEN